VLYNKSVLLQARDEYYDFGQIFIKKCVSSDQLYAILRDFDIVEGRRLIFIIEENELFKFLESNQI